MNTIDYKKELTALYSARKNRPAIVDVPRMQFLMFDGHGDPENSPLMQVGFHALYSLAYPIRFAIKDRDQIAYSVMPPEGLFWSSSDDLEPPDMAGWHWTLMLMQPDFVTHDDLDVAQKRALTNGIAPAGAVRFDAYEEGLSAQVMHVGPKGAEEPSIQLLHEFITSEGFKMRGKHHEIYLGDPRRAKPENLRTIIRQPVE